MIKYILKLFGLLKMTTVKVAGNFKTSKSQLQLGEFMGVAFDYYTHLEDKLFGKILEDVDREQIIDSQAFKSYLKQQIHETSHQ